MDISHYHFCGSDHYHSLMEQDSPNGLHVYRPSKNARTFFAVMGCFIGIMGIWLFSKSLPGCIEALKGGSSVTGRVVNGLMPVLGCFFVIGGILQVRVYWKRILILTTNAVQVEFIYGLKTLKFDDILGWRSRATQYGHCTVIVPKEKRLRKVVIKEGFVVDDFYRNWLALLPDLDAADKEKRRAAGKLHFWES
jgi:hypothetical protein